jgi:hypothetical protein
MCVNGEACWMDKSTWGCVSLMKMTLISMPVMIIYITESKAYDNMKN